MSWKRLGNTWLNKNDTINLALWRKVSKYAEESFSVALSMNTQQEPEVKEANG